MDMISQLPESIIHDILCCLPNKDSARTCVLSKTWRNLHATKPFMVFNHFEFDPQMCGLITYRMRREFQLPRSMTSGKKDLFMGNVESSLNLFFHQQQQLRKFDLTLCTYDQQDFGHVDQWLHGVIHNGIGCLSLHMISFIDCPYPLPHHVLSSKMLHELCLCGSLLLDSCIDINLPALQVLTLCNIHSLNDDLVKYLFSGCPFVEVLRIKDCNNLVDLQVSSLVRLVDLSLNSCRFVRNVEIGSPKFQSFSYSRGSSNFPHNITLLGASKTLRKLKLDICCIGHRIPFHQLSTFIQIEELFLDYVDLGKFLNMKISSRSLKRLVIRSLHNMTGVVKIECPYLHELEYTSNVLPFYSLWPLNPKHFRVEFLFHAFHHEIRLDALKTLFESGFSTAKYPKVIIVLKDHKEVIILDLDSGLIDVMLFFLCRVEDLESKSRIIIASNFDNLNEILTPMPPHMAFNMASSCTSNFTQIFSEKLSRILESCGCIVEEDTTTVNIPIGLRQCLSASCQITRIVSKWDWTI